MRFPLIGLAALAPLALAHAEAADLSYPPPGEQAPRIQVERGERNVGRPVDSAGDIRRHIIIGPDFSIRAPAADDGAADGSKAAAPAPRPRLVRPAAAPPSADASRPENANALLWRVSSPDGRVSHLFGTIHLEDPRVLALPEPVDAAFRDARTIVLEARLDEINPLALAGQMMLQDGRTLEDIAGKALFESAAALLARKGVPGLVAQRLEPWAAAVMLSVPQPQTGRFLDRVLADRARSAGKTVRGLERLDEQVDALAGMSEPEQVALLRESVARFEQLPAALEQMVQAYLARDVERLVSLGRQYGPADSALAKTFEQRLIVTRNQRMAERVQPALEGGGAFVAVGAMHLAGPEGLPRLLEQAGYRVEPVY